KPKTIEGTAAKLFIFISIKSVSLFLGAYSSKYSEAATPTGKATIKTIKIKYKEPIKAVAKPAFSGLLESLFINKPLLKELYKKLSFFKILTQLTTRSEILRSV